MYISKKKNSFSNWHYTRNMTWCWPPLTPQISITHATTHTIVCTPTKLFFLNVHANIHTVSLFFYFPSLPFFYILNTLPTHFWVTTDTKTHARRHIWKLACTLALNMNPTDYKKTHMTIISPGVLTASTKKLFLSQEDLNRACLYFTLASMRQNMPLASEMCQPQSCTDCAGCRLYLHGVGHSQ